jgi:hypothetical protein
MWVGIGRWPIFGNWLTWVRFGWVWVSERVHWPKRLEVLSGDSG